MRLSRAEPGSTLSPLYRQNRIIPPAAHSPLIARVAAAMLGNGAIYHILLKLWLCIVILR